jgi:hypothetical protein
MKPEEELFLNKSFDEIEDYNKYLKEQKKSHKQEQENITNKMNIGIIHDIKQSKKSVPKDRDKEDMISNIQVNKKVESSEYGLTQALRIDSQNKDKTKIEKSETDKIKKYESRDHILDIIINS